MLIPIEFQRRTYHTVIDIPFIMEYRAASRAPPNEYHIERAIAQQAEIDFHPGILVAPNDDAGAIGVEEEDRRVCGRLLQEVVFDGEV